MRYTAGLNICRYGNSRQFPDFTFAPVLPSNCRPMEWGRNTHSRQCGSRAQLGGVTPSPLQIHYIAASIGLSCRMTFNMNIVAGDVAEVTRNISAHFSLILSSIPSPSPLSCSAQIPPFLCLVCAVFAIYLCVNCPTLSDPSFLLPQIRASWLSPALSLHLLPSSVQVVVSCRVRVYVGQRLPHVCGGRPGASSPVGPLGRLKPTGPTVSTGSTGSACQLLQPNTVMPRNMYSSFRKCCACQEICA